MLLTSSSGFRASSCAASTLREGTVTELAHNLITGNLDDLSHTSKVVISRERNGKPNGPDTAIRPGIILGKKLSMRLGVFPGDTLNVVSPWGRLRAPA